MKTPWKFLARLNLGRSSAKAQPSSSGNETGSKTLEIEVEHTSALPSSPTVAANPPVQDEDVSIDQGPIASDKAEGRNDVAQVLEPPAGADEAQASVRDEAGDSGTEASSLLEKSAPSAKSQSKPRIRRGERGKSANAARVAAQSAAAPKRHDNLQARSSRELFLHELATLDEEIKALRIQLAQKLHLQNVQLKTMLERLGIT
ncbi:hypothetical protein [Sinorhizobium meliloti]|uniref:hypothetical protein n=1 Tax=Rhizobium meliloti TaxID=382 RepID=UPI000FDA9A53|nr:hypothetical protein [Sinorhizobium meliloti]RVH98080.1 hypothetical protein CN199_06315 [Sinorhizobium meliloti]RVL21260.1 hypothetical protein CN143_09900 [Sinorhizobium meliloti]RVP35297.1 hypothetical protein CN081_20815 [Sinorhizobium meliloti]